MQRVGFTEKTNQKFACITQNKVLFLTPSVLYLQLDDSLVFSDASTGRTHGRVQAPLRHPALMACNVNTTRENTEISGNFPRAGVPLHACLTDPAAVLAGRTFGAGA